MWKDSHQGVKGQAGTFQLCLAGDLNQMQDAGLKRGGEEERHGGGSFSRWLLEVRVSSFPHPVPLLGHKELSGGLPACNAGVGFSRGSTADNERRCPVHGGQPEKAPPPPEENETLPLIWKFCLFSPLLEGGETGFCHQWHFQLMFEAEPLQMLPNV